jgi:hypothetical protein
LPAILLRKNRPLEIVSGQVDEEEAQNQVEDFRGIDAYIDPDNRCLKARPYLPITIGRPFGGGIGNRGCLIGKCGQRSHEENRQQDHRE